MKAAFRAAYDTGEDTFISGGEEYRIFRNGASVNIGQTREAALATMHVFDAASSRNVAVMNSFAFRSAVEAAIAGGEQDFTLDGTAYRLEDNEGAYTVWRVDAQGQAETFANVSGLIINPILPDVFLGLDFKARVAEAIEADEKGFTYEGQRFTIDLVHQTYNIKTDTVTRVLKMYSAPSAAHPLGTDQNGMDMLTRLMYGGRISLMVGFVVIFLEMFIGILIGGISGYFGKWVDTLLMRFIDLFNCIPYWPIMLIMGSVMDTLQVDSYVRIFLLMVLLGLLGWTGIARVVRGQILALREQDFMVATEATGVRISRRIIKHLVPNVMPLLIVQATLGLGGIILTEATLSFLGLGVKYPLASWGSIINAASEPYVVTNFWFIWVPAGLLILLTVLGFNFVGDGLRDAFDPKMKR
ncbi:MAG TPA: ABC transporter permease [Candidatus Limnocylindria bacterium]|nr:ABC transporter permease [Candidatus Limnocylindria bacterium]